MSSIDKRIVEMSFDNKQFESGVQTSLKSLENLRGGLDDTGKSNALAGLSSGVQAISDKFSALGIMGVTALQNITNSAVNFGKQIISSLTVDPIMAGFSEYETQINAVQTILANTQGSQKKVSQEAVAAVNDTAISATKATKQANEAALENLKNTQQKQLREHEKLADEELKVLKNRYDEESDALGKAINKENSDLKEAHQEKVSLIDEELKVLKNRYDEGSEALDKAITKENRDLKEAHQEKLSIYQDEYMAKLKTIDEERYNKLKAIDDEIAAINDLTKTEKEAQEISEQNKKLQELQSKVTNAKDIEERVKAEERLMEYKEELGRKQVLKERQQRIDLLKDNKDSIKEEYKLAEEQAKDEYKNKKDQENELHQTTVENLKEEHSEKKKLLKSDYENEKELLKDKQDSENELYEAKSANLKEEQAEKKKLLKDIYETEKESVQDRQDAEKDALKERQSAEIKSLKKYNEDALTNIETRKKAELKALTEINNAPTKGSTLDDVNRALDELNEYADKTIYNFTEMTRNIGTFTAAGIDLDTSVQAIKGIANLAAVSGSTSQQASTAMYQLSQALSSGTMKIQDWNSVNTAGMGGQVFQDALKETARVHGIAIDQMIMEEGSFRETLHKGWLTSEVLTETLSKFTGDLNEEQLRTMGYTDEQIKSIIKMGQTANDAATKVKTFTQLFDTLKEAAQSGWTQSWEIIIGDFEEAKELLTEMSDIFGGIIGASADSRNDMLFGGLTSGWKQLLAKGIDDSEGYKEAVIAVAKEHGIAIDEMIASAGSFEKSLKGGWLTADILSESLSKLTDKTSGLSDEELKASGYTRKQIDALESLNASVKDGSISLDEFAEKMSKASGRENLIAALKNSFEGLISVITPIKDAFREIFPPITADRLYALTEGLRELTEKFKIGDETADKIKRTFAGLFALLDIGKQAFSFLFGKVGELVGVLAPGAGGILNFTAAIGDFIVKLNEAVKSGDLFNVAFDNVKNFIIAVVKAIKDDIDGLKETTAFQGLQSLIESAADKIKNAFNKIKDVFSGWGGIDLSGLKSFTENAELHFRPFTALGVGLSKAFDFIVSVFKKVQPFFTSMATIVGDAFKKLGGAVSGAFKDGGIQGVADLINGGIFTVILLGIKHFIDTLSDVTSNASGILEGITGILDGVKGSLEAYQNSLKAKTLITIAGAVALLAGALVVLSMIEAEKLAVALGAMTVIFIELAASMIVMQKAMGSGKMIQVSTTMIAMAAAILILSVALKSLAELDWDGIVRGATGIGILMIELQGFINNVKGEKLMSTSVAMIAIGAAMKILASAVADLGELDIEVLMKGIGALGLILGEMIIFINLIKPEKLTSTGIAMIAIGTAMKILASAVADLGALDIPTLAKGLASMGVILAEIGVFATLIEPTKLVSTGIAMIAIGASMLIFAEAIGKMGSLSVEEIAKGLITMAGALTIIIAATTFMPSDMGGKAAAMLVLSAALVVLSQAMQNMGDMTWEEIAKGLVTLAASLTIITIAMQFMTGGLAGAAAMLVMANALLIFTPALMMLGSMDLDEIGKALLTLVGVFVIVGASGALLAPLTPAILGLSGAIALLGVGVLAIGAGLLAFSAGLTALGIAGTAGAAALVIVVTSLLSLIPLAIAKLGEGVVAFAGVIKKGMPAIMEAVKAIFEGLILLLVELTPPFLDAVLNFLDETLSKLVEYVPKFVDAGLKILIGLLQGISDNIEEVVKVAIDIVVNLLKGITGKIPDVIKVGVDIVVALIKAIGEETPRLIAAGFQMIIDFINGLADTIREKTPLLVEAFWNLASAILEGLTSGLFAGVKGVVDAIVNVGKAIINGFKNLLGINSPSKVFTDFAGNIIKGLVNGIGNGISSVISKAKEIGSAVIDNVKNKFSEIGDVAGNVVSGLANGLKNGISNIVDAAKDLGASALEGIKNFLNINSPSKKFEEVGEYSGEGMVAGLKNMIGAVKNSAGSMGKTAITALSKAMESVSDLVSSDIDSNPTITPVLDFSMIENGLGRIDKMLSLRKTISLDLSNVSAASNSSNARVITERQNKVQNQQPTSIVNQFDCTGMVVRSDKDIDEIATKLYQKQQAASRGKGVRTPVHIH